MEFVQLHAEVESWIAEGLRNGTLKRWGTGIRNAKGQPGAGQFVRHLREVYPVDFVKQNANLVQLPPSLSPAVGQVLQLTQVAAAARVVNVGVSAVGFAVMNHKLNRLQSCVDGLSHDLRDLRGVVECGLASIDQQLVEIRYLQVLGFEVLTEVREVVELVRKDLLAEKSAVVASWMRELSRGDPGADLRTALRELDQVRLWLEQTIAVPSAESSLWADAVMRYRVWCMAVVAQVAVARMAGQDDDAAALAGDASMKSFEWVSRWAAVLLPADEFDGVFRLGAEPFRGAVQLETIVRLSTLQLTEQLPDVDTIRRTERVALRVAGHRKSSDSNWRKRSLQAAELLDFGAETHARLSSLASEMQECRERRLGYDEWEGLQLDTSRPELRLLEMPA